MPNLSPEDSLVEQTVYMVETMDPMIIKGIEGAGVLLLASVLVWYDKIDKATVSMLLVGAAAAIGFQVTPGG